MRIYAEPFGTDGKGVDGIVRGRGDSRLGEVWGMEEVGMGTGGVMGESRGGGGRERDLGEEGVKEPTKMGC